MQFFHTFQEIFRCPLDWNWRDAVLNGKNTVCENYLYIQDILQLQLFKLSLFPFNQQKRTS